ncbi:MAG: tellurite resistance TerB family protein [Desulfobacteraceae bacterium]|nr:tellurite resistance TerB family protein [Desulfobacteraceae bacterium]
MGLMDEVKKVRSKKFMEAAAAGCAMVVSANGHVKPEELAKLADFIRIDESLKVFELQDVFETFENYVQDFEFDFRIGKEKALKAIDKIKKNSDEARMLLIACIAIGTADEELDEKEREVIREICCKLELNPSEFDLQSKFPPPLPEPYRQTGRIYDDPEWTRLRKDVRTPDKDKRVPEWMKDPSKILKPPEKPVEKDKKMPEWMKDTSKIPPPDKDKETPEWMKDTSKLPPPGKDKETPEWMKDTSKLPPPGKDKEIPEWMKDTSKPSGNDKNLPEWMKEKSEKTFKQDNGIPEWMKK